MFDRSTPQDPTIEAKENMLSLGYEVHDMKPQILARDSQFIKPHTKTKINPS